MTLKPSLSAYLDFLRFVAALAVLLGHMDLDGLTMEWMPLSRFSHEAVIIFFVLSGFIIYYSTISRASSWQQYAVARLSRIYSVALPSVFVCSVLALVLVAVDGLDPFKMSNFRELSFWDTASSLLFLNPSWMNDAELTMNGPYWSLCYEVWYYVIFGFYFFFSGRKRWLLVGFASLVAGPPILLLLPIWLMGAWLAKSGRYEIRLCQAAAWISFLAPLVLIYFIDELGIERSIQLTLYEQVPGYWRLFSSQRFVTDYVIGLALCLHIAAYSSLPVTVQNFFARHQGLFATLAGFSFTLYLFHRPMTQLLGAWYPQPAGAVWQTALLALGILLACWAISWGTEKQLPRWRRAFARGLLPRRA